MTFKITIIFTLQETREGPPKEIFKSTSASSDRDDEEINLNDHIINDNGEEFDSEALRKYQLERLRFIIKLIKPILNYY